MTRKMVYCYFNDVEKLEMLCHPNILKFHETYEDEKRYYLVTELCTGDELYDAIDSRLNDGETFSERESAQIIIQVIRAV